MKWEEMDGKKSWDRGHERKIYQKNLWKQKNKDRHDQETIKRRPKKNWRNDSSPQILTAKTTFGTRKLGIRSNAEKPGSPFLHTSGFLLVMVQSVTWSLLEPKTNTGNKRTKEKPREFVLTENSSQIASILEELSRASLTEIYPQALQIHCLPCSPWWLSYSYVIRNTQLNRVDS